MAVEDQPIELCCHRINIGITSSHLNCRRSQYGEVHQGLESSEYELLLPCDKDMQRTLTQCGPRSPFT
jgi:hypothetical protein